MTAHVGTIARTKLEYALDAVDGGREVLPLHWTNDEGICSCDRGAGCKSPGKHPLFSGGAKNATRRRDQVREWWTLYPLANIGSPTDEDFTIDIDGPEGEAALASLEVEHSFLPQTRVHRTQSGGRHLIFSGVGPTTASSLGRKIDTRGAGGYILWIGSTIGQRHYALECDCRPAEAPSWVLSLLNKRRDKEHAIVEDEDTPASISRARRRLEALVAAGDVAVEGAGGNDRTYRLFVELRDFGLSVDKAVELVLEIWNPHCDGPWDEDEVRNIAEHAYEYAQNEAGCKGISGADIYASLAVESAPALSAARVGTWHPLSLAEQDSLPEPDWLVPGVVPNDSLTLIYGPPGSYKSFIAGQMLFELSAGLRCFAPTTPPRGVGCPVVYYAAEGPRGLVKIRRPAWMLFHGITGDLPFYVVPRVPSIANDDLDRACEALEQANVRPAAVIFDTSARMMGGLDENSAADIGRLIDGLNRVRERLGCAVINIHHSGKDQDRGARGSSRFLADFDAVFRVQAEPDVLAVKMICEKMKDADEPLPIFLKGQRFHGSLVFTPSSKAEYRALTTPDDELARTNVAAALMTMGARGPAAAVPVRQLAATILAKRDNAPAEGTTEHGAALGTIVRQLQRRTGKNGPLELHGEQRGQRGEWFFFVPEVEDEE